MTPSSPLRFSVTPFYLCLQLGLLSSLIFTPGEALKYLNYSCPVSSNIATAMTPNTTYQTNLDLLFSFLSSNASIDTGFYNSSVGREPSDDVVYGMFLCRGDLTPQLCEECVAAAVNKSRYYCQGAKKAAVWYDECILDYRNQSIFSTVMEEPILPSKNEGTVAEPGRFNRTLEGIMESMRREAVNDRYGKKYYYATKEENYFASQMQQRVFSLVQCTPDLSPEQCDQCISGLTEYLLECCSTYQGARVVFPSCNFRYEFYPFYAAAVEGEEAPDPTPLPPPPPSQPTGTKGKYLLTCQAGP